MSFISKIFSKGAKDIIDSGSNMIDELSTSDDEKLSAKARLSKIVLDALSGLQDAQRDIILTEAKGNFLQRSWRPLIMLSFALLIILGAFMEIPYLNDNSPFWDLLKIGMGGYVIGRSAEKISDNITRNIDIPFIKKKDRKIK